jgi:phospholipid/cholesterol/gamma-HCH transport system ATP-binding protein
MIEYRELRKAYGAPVLAGVNLCIARGETVAIVGRSGSGKSVLLRTTIGLVEPDDGDVLIDGRSLYLDDGGALDRVRRHTGYVFQNAALFDSLTVHENVALGLRDDDLRALGESEVARRVASALEDVHLDPAAMRDRLPGELSGGMKKRVGIARAVIGRPEILLYDEPVTGLDPVTAASISRLLVTLSRRTGATSVMVTHDIDGALALSDRVALLEAGVFRLVGPPELFRTSDDPLVAAFVDRGAAARAAAAWIEAQGEREHGGAGA